MTSLNWEVLGHPPYCPDMSPPDFDLFPKVKENLRGVRFANLEELEAATAAEVQRIKSGCLETGIANLPLRWNMVIEMKGHYFEGM